MVATLKTEREQLLDRFIENLEAKKGTDWKLVLGTEIYSPSQLIKKIKNDKDFQELIIHNIHQLSIDLITGRIGNASST